MISTNMTPSKPAVCSLEHWPDRKIDMAVATSYMRSNEERDASKIEVKRQEGE